jgi:hypothetical protein
MMPPIENQASLALNYGVMRNAMIGWVRELAGDLWSNYNESDPGVTIIEHLCFVLTELGLRAEQPTIELLASPQSGRLQLDRQGLYAAQDILPGSALTLLDQRRWLLDQIPDAANIWLTPLREGTHGLYQATVLPRLQESERCLCPGDLEEIRQDLAQQVRRSFCQLRNLGEDLAEVVVLTPQPLKLAAKLITNGQRPVEAIQAQILYQLGLYLAPEPRRHGLEADLQKGRTTATIYLGPPMQRGFIEDEELLATIPQPNGQEIKEIIASIPGVLEVEDLNINEINQTDLDPSRRIEPKQGHFLCLDLNFSDSSAPLRLYRDGQHLPSNPARVARLLKSQWQEHRRTYALEQSFQQTFPLPVAISAEDGDYTSIQTLFPSVYGLSGGGADKLLTANRQGAIKQLKGYLMIFDQLLADFAAQLAFCRDLFSPRAGGERTFAYQSLQGVSGCDAGVLTSSYESKLAALNLRLDRKEPRQAMILDFFLALYGQQLLPFSTDTSNTSSGRDRLQALLQSKQELLRGVVSFSRQRGCGVDYHDLEHITSPTALERRCALELRARRFGGASEIAALETRPDRATFGQLMSASASERVRQNFLILDGLMAPLAIGEEEEGERESEPSNPFAGKTVATVLWTALANPKSYRIGGCEGGEDVDLVCLDGEGGCWWLGSFSHARLAHAQAHQLLKRAGSANDAVCVVEWVLLRHALLDAGASLLEASAFHSRISIVMMRQRSDQQLITTVERVLRPHLPAHLEMTVHLLKPRRFARFLELREAWLRSLAGADPERRARLSLRLVQLLLDPPRPASQPTQPASMATPPESTTATAGPPASPPALPAPSLAPAISLRKLALAATADAEGARSDRPVEHATLRQWRSAGLRFLMRPLPLANQPEGALSQEELDGLLREGLALMPCQDPSAAVAGSLEDLGRLHGEEASQAAEKLGMASGVVIWLSSFPEVIGANPAAVLPYLNLWSQTVKEAGFESGLFLTGTLPSSGLNYDWLCRADPTVSPPMLGYGLLLEAASVRPEPLVGLGATLRVQRDRRGLLPNWLALDPRALPPRSP